jgi:hypothetical protein
MSGGFRFGGGHHRLGVVERDRRLHPHLRSSLACAAVASA